MSQVNATLDAFRAEFQTQFSTNVDPLHKDLHDLLEQQMQAAARIEKLGSANFVTPEGLQQKMEGLAEHVAQAIAAKILPPTVQPTIPIIDQSLADRIAKLESRLRFF
jgi:hypothetical protein